MTKTKPQELEYIRGKVEKQEPFILKEYTLDFGTVEKLYFKSKGKKIEISVKDFMKAIKKLGGKDNDKDTN